MLGARQDTSGGREGHKGHSLDNSGRIDREDVGTGGFFGGNCHGQENELIDLPLRSVPQGSFCDGRHRCFSGSPREKIIGRKTVHGMPGIFRGRAKVREENNIVEGE